MFFIDFEKSVHIKLKKLIVWSVEKNRIPKALVRAMISLYDRAKTKDKVEF